MLSLQVLLVPLLVVVRVGSVTQVENKEASTGQSAGSHVGTIETGGALHPQAGRTCSVQDAVQRAENAGRVRSAQPHVRVECGAITSTCHMLDVQDCGWV